MTQIGRCAKKGTSYFNNEVNWPGNNELVQIDSTFSECQQRFNLSILRNIFTSLFLIYKFIQHSVQK